MEEIMKLIDTLSEDEIDSIVDKIKKRVIIPVYFRKEDLEIILGDLHDDPSSIIDTQIHSITLRYYKLRDESLTDGTLFFDDIYRYLIEYTGEMNLDNHWSHLIETIIYGLEDFDTTNRDNRIDNILS